MVALPPDQEQEIIDALVALGEVETEQSLMAEGVLTIKCALNCSADEAQNILDGLRDHRLIEPDITRGGQLDAREPMPMARWRYTHTVEKDPLAVMLVSPSNQIVEHDGGSKKLW